MKTKLLIAMAIFAIIGIVANFTACDNDSTPKTFTVTFDTDGGTPQPPDR